MSALELTLRLNTSATTATLKRLLIPVAIFTIVFISYYLSTNQLFTHTPPDWYKHHVYVAKAMLEGTFDVNAAGIPDFYHDTINFEGHKYAGVPLGPSVVLVPFVAIWGTGFQQLYFVMVLGAINAVLFWYLLGLLNISNRTRLLLVPFFAFGTVNFYSATTGTAWFYNHILAVTGLLLALIFLFKKASPVVPALFLGLAFLSREPTILAAPAFLLIMWYQQTDSFSKDSLLDKDTLLRLGLFCAALVPFVGLFAWYNYARFNDIFETGYETLYHMYIRGNIYSFYRADNASAEHYSMFDLRNIPLQLYTIFLMPPEYVPGWSLFRPSPYGLSVLITSPAFVYALLVKRRDIVKTACWLAIGFISIPLLLYFMQGWVQFGYRFLLDFAPFLLILTAFGFDDNQSRMSNRTKVLLVAFSVVVGFWGRYWGNRLGW